MAVRLHSTGKYKNKRLHTRALSLEQIKERREGGRETERER